MKKTSLGRSQPRLEKYELVLWNTHLRVDASASHIFLALVASRACVHFHLSFKLLSIPLPPHTHSRHCETEGRGNPYSFFFIPFFPPVSTHTFQKNPQKLDKKKISNIMYSSIEKRGLLYSILQKHKQKHNSPTWCNCSACNWCRSIREYVTTISRMI